MLDFEPSQITGYEGATLDEANTLYLRNYWLNIDDLVRDWAGVLDRSFELGKGRAGVSPDLNAEARLGGVLLTDDEFVEFKRLAIESGATRFAVVEYVGQDQWKSYTSLDFFRFSYPLDISWAELACSCSIADDVYMRPIRVYFLVTDNGRVGKYADSDAARPYELFFH